MKQADLLKKIEQLEARVRELEARPVYVPYPVQVPYQQPVVGPWRYWEGPTCGSGAGHSMSSTVTNFPCQTTLTAQ